MSTSQSTTDILRARDALAAIPADLPHVDWVRIAMAIKAAGLELADFDQWSATAPNRYSATACRDTWKSIKRSGGIGPGTLFHAARAHGWRESRHAGHPLGRASSLPPRKPPTRPPEAPRQASPQHSTGDYARALWTKVSRDDDVVGEHPYCVKKGITLAGGAGRGQASGKVIGRNGDCLIIPIRDIRTDGVVAVQCINAEGAKQTFGPVRGHAFICGNTLDQSIPWFVVEGWADAVSIVFHAHQGNAAAFACMGHHFDLVARTVAEHFAPQRLVILEDAP
jgi:putative DNA primase/helicase